MQIGLLYFYFEGRTFPVDQFFLEDAIEFTRYIAHLLINALLPNTAGL